MILAAAAPAVLISFSIGIPLVLFCGKNDRDRIKSREDLRKSLREEEKERAFDRSLDRDTSSRSTKSKGGDDKSDWNTSSKSKKRSGSKSRSLPCTPRSSQSSRRSVKSRRSGGKTPHPKNSKGNRSKRSKKSMYSTPKESHVRPLDRSGSSREKKKDSSSGRRSRLRSIKECDGDRSNSPVDRTQNSGRSVKSRRDKSIDSSPRRKKCSGSRRSKSHASTPKKYRRPKNKPSTRQKRRKRSSTVTDEKKKDKDGPTAKSADGASKGITKKSSKNQAQEEAKEKSVEEAKPKCKGTTKRKVQPHAEKPASTPLPEKKEPKSQPEVPKAKAEVPKAQVEVEPNVSALPVVGENEGLTHGLTVPDNLKGKLYDPEKDERSIKVSDPENPSPEQLKRLQNFVTQCASKGAAALLEEFEGVKSYNVDLPANTTYHVANPTKNRYRDIFCIDKTRVILKGDKEGDYINANWVKGTPFLNEFSTQGPLEATMNDFWRMVVQENVGYIVMLCDIVELGKKKCEKYIPETPGESQTYGDYKVTLINGHIDGHFTNSILTLDIPGKQSRIVYHHQWRNWPDRGVPLTALAGLRVLRHARLTKCPTIIHCSAGVGRTGTLVAIEYMLQTTINGDGPYDMREMVKVLRNQRAHAIQTAPQYAYIVQAILRLLVTLDSSNPEANANYQQFTGIVALPYAYSRPTVRIQYSYRTPFQLR